MKKVKTKFISVLQKTIYGTPIKGVKAYTITSFNTVEPSEKLDYNSWCQSVNFSSAVIKKYN